MPTYEYRCSECGYQFEEFQSMKADPLTTCPACNAESLKRLLGAGAGLIFKGNGFYITDYKKNGNGQDKKPASTGKKEANDSATTKKDTTTKSSTSSDKS